MRDAREDDELAAVLREAAAPDLVPGAAERIAAGAWDRAARLRASRAPRFRVLRRSGWAAAAAVLLGAAVFALRGTDPAFAVEGEPVLVRKGDEWVATRVVAADALVRADAATSVLRWVDGATLRPRANSLFRLSRDAAASIRVEFERGGGDVDGAAFVVTAARTVEVEGGPAAGTLRFSFVLDGGVPRVEASAGRAIVRSLVSDDEIALAPRERAALVDVRRNGAVERRLARVEPWSTLAASEIVRGGLSVLDAGFGAAGRVTLVGSASPGALLAFEVAPGDVAQALRSVNVAARFSMNVGRSDSAAATKVVYEKGAVRVEAVVSPCGMLRVDDGSGVRTYADVASFRRAAPETAALFGDALTK